MEYDFIYEGNIVRAVKKKAPPPVKRREIGIRKVDIVKENTCLNGYFKQLTYSVQNGLDISIENYLKNVEPYIVKSLENNVGTKVIIGLTTNMRQGDIIDKKFFKTYPITNYAWTNKQKLFKTLFSQLVSVYNNTEFEGSGWSLVGNVHVSLNYGKYKPFKGGCSSVDLPKWLSNKKALISMVAGDNKCFFWNVLHFFNPRTRNRERVDKNLRRIFEEEPHLYADFTGVSYPVSSDDIESFQKKNPHIYILVYGVDENTQLTPLIYDGKEYVKKDDYKIIPMVYYREHYFLVNDLSRLLSTQIKGYSGKRLLFCFKCRRDFTEQEKLDKHVLTCRDTMILKLPDEENKIIRDKKTETIPPCMSIYADFESLVTPCTPEEQEKGKYQKHIPSCWCFFVKSYCDVFSSFHRKRVIKPGEKIDIAKDFVENLMFVIRVNLEKFKRAKQTLPTHTPVFFHNLTGYNAHLFVIKLAAYNLNNLTVLPSSEKNYISFSKFLTVDGKKHEIRFLDSLRFLDSSIDVLASELSEEEMIETKKCFPNVPIEILKGKGFYPYDWMDSEEKLSCDSLPPHESFFSTLKNGNITAEEYKKAQLGWKAFGCKTMRDYIKTYCQRDVMLLCDIFENFRAINKKEYDVDPILRGYTLPGVSWANMLRYTKQEIELITDRETYEDFEAGIRGGVSMCVTRHAKANNKYMKDYDPTQPSCFLFYVDENNLYGNSMSKRMPYGIEKKMDSDELKEWRNYYCAIVVDLEIPEDKHDFLNEFPPAPEHLIINGVKKLVPNLRNKKKYLVYSELLIFYVDVLGLKITRIYRGYIFKCSKWLQPYIENNTRKRILASKENKVSKESFYKKNNNSIYGKTIENPRKRCSVELVNSVQRARKLTRSPEYLHWGIIF